MLHDCRYMQRQAEGIGSHEVIVSSSFELPMGSGNKIQVLHESTGSLNCLTTLQPHPMYFLIMIQLSRESQVSPNLNDFMFSSFISQYLNNCDFLLENYFYFLSDIALSLPFFLQFLY